MYIKRKSNFITATIALIDLVLIALAFLLAYRLRFGSLQGLDRQIWLLYVSAPVIIALLNQQKAISDLRHHPLRRIFGSTLFSFLLAAAISATVLYLTKQASFSRLLFIVYFCVAVALVAAEKCVLKKIVDAQFQQGRMCSRVAMVGFGTKFNRILEDLRHDPKWGVNVVCVSQLDSTPIEEVVRQLRDAVIDQVYICHPREADSKGKIDRLIERVGMFGLPIQIVLNFDEFEGSYIQQFSSIAGRHSVLLSSVRMDPDRMVVKRIVDISGALTGLLLTVILFPAIAAAIKLDSGGPIFYSQKRVGKSGRLFIMYKFRSMYENSEETTDKLMARNLHQGPIFKVENDPRVTFTGRILRKYSLDELPQFWNVLKGDMSLVGPRPPTMREISQYEDHHFPRISIRPGMTGFWQTRGRNRVTDFEDIVALDVEYISSWNILVDLQVILKTLWVVLHPDQRNS